MRLEKLTAFTRIQYRRFCAIASHDALSEFTVSILPDDYLTPVFMPLEDQLIQPSLRLFWKSIEQMQAKGLRMKRPTLPKFEAGFWDRVEASAIGIIDYEMGSHLDQYMAKRTGEGPKTLSDVVQ